MVDIFSFACTVDFVEAGGRRRFVSCFASTSWTFSCWAADVFSQYGPLRKPQFFGTLSGAVFGFAASKNLAKKIKPILIRQARRVLKESRKKQEKNTKNPA